MSGPTLPPPPVEPPPPPPPWPGPTHPTPTHPPTRGVLAELDALTSHLRDGTDALTARLAALEAEIYPGRRKAGVR